MLEQYKAHYFKQQKGNKYPDSNWRNHYTHIEAVLNQYSTSFVDLKIVREIIEKTANNSPNRTKHLNGLVNLFKYFGNTEFKEIIKQYKTQNNPKSLKKYIPHDREIMTIYNLGFKPDIRWNKRFLHKNFQWQFLYSLLAIYGLRVHEAWNIKNWDKPVILKNGDWVIVPDDDIKDTDDESEKGKYYYKQWQGESVTVPAILDPNNKHYLLCIGHETKTGYRMAFPISPLGHDWIQEFNLLQPLNLPDMLNPLKKRGNTIPCSNNTAHWFKRKKYGFTPHALRHAYNIRGHKLGINQKILADSLGHGLRMNGSTYLKNEGDLSKLQGLMQAITEDKVKRSEIEILKAEIEHLKVENGKLRTKLAMYEAIKTDL